MRNRIEAVRGPENNNLTHSLTLLIYIQVNEYDYYSDCFSTKVKHPFIVA